LGGWTHRNVKWVVASPLSQFEVALEGPSESETCKARNRGKRAQNVGLMGISVGLSNAGGIGY